MATIYSDIGTRQLDTKNKRQPGGLVSGNVCMAIATVTLTAAMAAADILRLVKLPPGVIPLPHLSKVIAQDPGTALIFTIGDDLPTADPDKYSAALDISAGGKFDFVEGAVVGALTPVALTDEAWITATLGTVTALTVGNKVVFYIAYSAVS